VRGEKATQLLESGLKVKEYELLRRNLNREALADGRLSCSGAPPSLDLLPQALHHGLRKETAKLYARNQGAEAGVEHLRG
jgi:hypothetical protein